MIDNPADLPPSDDPPGDPLDRVTLDASLNSLMMVVLASLRPAKRVAFVLHDVFGVPYRTIAQIVGRSPSATRKLARSARQQIHHRHPDEARLDPAGGIGHELFLASAAGDLKRVERLLDPEITVLIDHGAAVQSIDPVRSVPAAAALLIDLLADEQNSVSEQSVNGHLGLVLRRGGQVVSIVMVNVRGGLVLDAWIAANPDKLRHWNRL